MRPPSGGTGVGPVHHGERAVLEVDLGLEVEPRRNGLSPQLAFDLDWVSADVDDDSWTGFGGGLIDCTFVTGPDDCAV